MVCHRYNKDRGGGSVMNSTNAGQMIEYECQSKAELSCEIRKIEKDVDQLQKKKL